MRLFGPSEARYRAAGISMWREGTSKRRPHSMSPPSVLPDISPTRGEISRPPGFRQSPASQKER